MSNKSLDKKDSLEKIENTEEEEEKEEEEKEEEEEEEEEEEDVTVVFETLFSEHSLSNMADVLGSHQTMMLVMYLNVPTTTLAYMLNAAIRGRRERDVLDRKMLTYWATLRSTTAIEVKVKELTKALNACEEDKVAEMVMTLAIANETFPKSSVYQKLLEDAKEEEEEEE